MSTQVQARRFDYGEMRSAERTPQGFLKVPAFATRVGVFPYLDGSGRVRRELRHPDDVFAPESMQTLQYAPFTIEHPPEMITPENVKMYSHGHTTERVERAQDKLDTDVIIESEEGIRAVEEDGIREVSCGYSADIVEEKGEWNGAPYDFRQINIRYNHLAGVRRGRAGPEVRMRLDSADAVMQTEFATESSVNDADTNVIGDPKTKKIVVVGREIELPSDAADTIQDMMDRFDEMRARLAQLEETMAKRNDVDVSQKGISPQVKVEQQSPDGRAAGGKTPARPGTITGGPAGKADAEKEEKDDADEEKEDGGEEEQGGVHKNARDDEEEKDDAEEKDDYEGSSAAAGGGSASDLVSRMKKDMGEMQKKMDAMQAKLDNYASEGFGKNEKKGDRNDSSKEQIRARVRLERQAEKMVPAETVAKFDSMSDDEVRMAVIQHHHPKADLKGKSTEYLASRFDHMAEVFDRDYEDEDRAEKRRDFGRAAAGVETRTDGADDESGDRFDGDRDYDPNKARLKMIQSGREEHRSDLSATKKKA